MNKITKHTTKIIVSIMIILVTLFLGSCNGNETVKPSLSEDEANQNAYCNTERTDESLLLTDEDFIVEDSATHLKLGEALENNKIVSEIVNKIDVSEKRSYVTLVYEDYSLDVSPSSPEILFGITLTTSKLETSRGIKVGDSIDDILQCYGETESNETDYLTYYHDEKFILFYLDDGGKITRITLELI